VNPEYLTSPTKSSVTQIPSTVISSGSKEEEIFPESSSFLLDMEKDENESNENDIWVSQNQMNSSIIRKPRSKPKRSA
jgi:hypothetical protein